MIDFQRVRVTFPTASGRPQSQTAFLEFPSDVNRAEAALNGFDIGYVGSDHHLRRTQIDTLTIINHGDRRKVSVVVSFSLRDNSGNFDDPFSGFVDVLVIVDRA